MGKFIYFRCITTICLNVNEAEYEYKLEERHSSYFSHNTCFKTFDQVSELLSFLKQSNYDLCHTLASTLEMATYQTARIYDQDFFDRVEDCSIVKTEDRILKSIQCLPYFKIIELSTNQPIKDRILLLSHNMLMLKMLGFDYVQLSGKLEGFEVFDCLKTTNWVLFYLSYFSFKMDKDAKQFVIAKDLIKLYDVDDREIIGDMTLYKNKTTYEGQDVNEIYFVFNMHNHRYRNNLLFDSD